MRELKAFRPHAIHIATEGPLGLAMWRYCRAPRRCRSRRPTTRATRSTSRARWPIPLAVSYAWLRRFHGAAARTFVSSASLEAQLRARGFKHLHLWRRGVDLQRFRPGAPHPLLAGLPRPIMAYVRAPGGREEHRGFPEPRAAGHQVGDRRRAAARRARARVSRRRVFAGYRFGEELVQPAVRQPMCWCSRV